MSAWDLSTAGDWASEGLGGALVIGQSAWASQPVTPSTVTVNATQAMQPVQDVSGSSWTGFFQDVLKTGLQYALVKDANANNVPIQTMPVYDQNGVARMPVGSAGYGSAMPGGGLGMLLLIGLGMFFVLKD